MAWLVPIVEFIQVIAAAMILFCSFTKQGKPRDERARFPPPGGKRAALIPLLGVQTALQR